jgi:lysophospholipase L1-like esterase
VVVSSYPYPVPTTIANQLHFFGDSITIGTASAGTPWADRLTVYLNKTHSNSGVFAAPLGDLIRHMHNADKTVWTGRTVFICMGVNDLKSASRTAQQYQELQMIINNAAIYGSLPVSAFINVRDDTRVVRNGTWINAPVFTSVGMGGLAADPGLWVQTNVTGRFVGFQFTVTVSMSATVHPVITTIIDGQTIQVGLRSMGTLPTSGLAGGGNYGRIWIWDTNSAAGERHHIKLMFGVTGNYASNVYIDNFLGFDYGHIGAATVLMGEIGNYVHMAWQGTLTNLQTLNNAFELVAYNARAVYGLPVYVAKNVYNFNEAQLDPDLLHPNPGGSEFVAQQFLRVIASLPT